MAFRPRTCVAVDFGTAACGYCFAMAEKGVGSARVLPFKPGDRASSATEKNLTAILLDAKTLKPVEIGREARRRFFDMDAEEQKQYAYIGSVKMAMYQSTLPLTERTVHGEGADIAVPLLTAVAKILQYIREEAEDRARSIGLDPAEIGWVLTVPAIFDDIGKSFMRMACVQGGLIPDMDSERLVLALEPEGALVATLMDAPAEVRARLRPGASRIMILDCGGGTVDVTVSELQGSDPPKLKEILPPSGGAWGGTYVDAAFRGFANELLMPEGREGTSHADLAATAAVMDAWEVAKCGWDPAEETRSRVTVTGLASVCEYVGGAEAMSKRVAEYNEKHGLSGADAIVYRPRSFSLVLPASVVRKMFDTCVEPICAHMQKLLVEAAELGKPISAVFLVGGFAESVYLQRSVREALQTEDGLAAELLIPAKPVQCVNRGSAVWGLYPNSFITSRISKYTLAVSLCERYNPALHDPVPHPSYLVINSSGTWVDNVLVPLVQKNDDVAVEYKCDQEVAPVRDGQTTVNFVLYRTARRLPPIAPGVRRTYVITDAVAKAAPPRLLEAHVPESAAVAKLSVLTGGGPAASTRATLSLFFGRTEIQAIAVSKSTGDRRKVAISFDAGAAMRAGGDRASA